MTLAALMQHSGVDAGTISYLENNHTEPTIQSTVLLASALNVTLPQLYSTLTERNPPSMLQPALMLEHHPDRRDVLNAHDLEAFCALVVQDPSAAYSILASLIYLATDLASGTTTATQIAKFPHPRELASADIHWFFTPSPVYWVDLRYPPIAAELLLDIYRQQGVFLFADAGAYIRERRQQREQSIARLSAEFEMSASTLNRFEIGSTENIKLADIVALDNKLSQHGEILGMYWAATSFYLALTGYSDQLDLDLDVDLRRASPNAMHLVTSFVKLCRWLEHLLEDYAWLQELRARMAELR